MNTTLDVATALAVLLDALGLEGCMACAWTALDDDTERAVLRVSSKGVTGLNPRGIGLDWDVYSDGHTIWVVGQNRAVGFDVTITRDDCYVEQREKLQALLEPLVFLHSDIFGCWSCLDDDDRTVMEYLKEYE